MATQTVTYKARTVVTAMMAWGKPWHAIVENGKVVDFDFGTKGEDLVDDLV